MSEAAAADQFVAPGPRLRARRRRAIAACMVGMLLALAGLGEHHTQNSRTDLLIHRVGQGFAVHGTSGTTEPRVADVMATMQTERRSRLVLGELRRVEVRLMPKPLAGTSLSTADIQRINDLVQREAMPGALTAAGLEASASIEREGDGESPRVLTAGSGAWAIWTAVTLTPLGAGVFVGAGLVALFYTLRLRPMNRAGACHDCGYDLRGSTTGVCPECGSRAVGRPVG